MQREDNERAYPQCRYYVAKMAFYSWNKEII